MKVAAPIVALTALVLSAAIQAQTPLRVGRDHWRAAHYPAARPPLLDHRQTRGGRLPEVDYMLGTSGCRIADYRQWGARVLNLMLYNYPLSAGGRRLVTTERDRCMASADLASPSYQVAALAPGATASGKMWFSGGANPIPAHPASLIRPFASGDLARRRVPLGDPERYRAVLASVAPDGATVRVIGRFGFVSTGKHTGAQLEQLATTLEGFTQYLKSTFELAPPATFIAVYLSPSQARLIAAADRIHNLRISPSTLGYAYLEDMSVSAMVSGTEGGTLLHELFHLILRDAYGDMPQWLDEGTASLFEVSRQRGGRFEGLPNWRGTLLAVPPPLRPSLARVIASGWFDFDGVSGGTAVGIDEARQLALARYLMLYLQGTGQLVPVFKAMRDREFGAAADPGAEAVAIVERFAGPMPALETRFWSWFATLGTRDDNRLPGVHTKELP